MSVKLLSVLIIGGLGLATLLVVSAALPSVAQAQCGGIESSCFKCHQETHPVCGTTEWHSEYGHRYACWNCHGGNDTAQDKELAHVSLVRHPLEDAYLSCHACHADDYQPLAERFAKVLGVTVTYHEPTPLSNTGSVSIATQPTVVPANSDLITDQTKNSSWVVLSFSLASALLLGWFVWKKNTLARR